MAGQWITFAGSFVADCAFRTKSLPGWGQTIMGSAFQLGPGGKGSNQAVAAARLGAKVSFICKLGDDVFGSLARQTYQREGIDTRFVSSTSEHFTGAASIVIDDLRGENAIVVVPGSGFQLTPEEIEQARPLIAESSAFVTQLEIPPATARRGLELARELGVTTILNPAPAMPLDRAVYPLCDYVTPNEWEARELTGITVQTAAEADRAADALLAMGARNVVITLGAQGAFVKNSRVRELVSAIDAGAVVETTGAGDAFNGGFAVALGQGMDIMSATRFACAVAAISVTRPGTANSMPTRSEVERLVSGRESSHAGR
jgi:ribokinase